MNTYGDLGKIAYEAWVNYLHENRFELGFASDYTIPEWEKLPLRYRLSWERVAETLFRTIRKLAEGETDDAKETHPD